MSQLIASFKIVGIGVSSGGANVVKALVCALPEETGCAFLLVPHLDVAHDNMLAELLDAEMHLTMTEVFHGVTLEPEHLYVVPPGSYVFVKDGKVHLIQSEHRHGSRLPFDYLLHSLAEEYGPRAISVILSGAGTDGSGAIGSINYAGGLVLAQELKEAELDGTPRSAFGLAIGVRVLPVAAIAEMLVKYQPKTADVLAVRRQHLLEILTLLNTTTSKDFSDYKHGTLQRRIEKRLATLEIAEGNLQQYIDILRDSEDEREFLANDLLINVTGFFRDREVFDLLRDTVIPAILRGKRQGDSVRIWIAGCSTGEEAYSLAILFLNRIEILGLVVELKIFASDADADAIATARAGRYSPSAAEAVPADLLRMYFMRDDTGYTVNAQLRASVVFTVHDILRDPPFSRIDMISCRNLLIYLETDAQAKLLSLFSFALREGGILVTGKSETIGRMDDRFKFVSKSERIYQLMRHHPIGEFHFSVTPVEKARLPISLESERPLPRQHSLAVMVSDLLLGRYVPAAVLINRRYEYLYSLGPTERLLHIPAGPVSQDLFALTPRSLHNKIRSAIHGATRSGESFVTKGAKVEADGVDLRFSVHVHPLKNNNDELFLICFVEQPRLVRGVNQTSGVAEEDASRIFELELELKETQTELQEAIHSLEIVSEEQKIITANSVSLNEEYQSTNEELLTSREELQSLNEELTALNNQLHETLERQRAISNDLENVLYSTDVPTLFLDLQLNIRFFTPATRAIFNVIPSDIGRPFSDLSSVVEDADLHIDVVAVAREGQAIDKEISARNDRWYIRRIKPYRMQHGGVEGVVVTFIDVSAQKHLAEDKEAARRNAELASEAKSHFLAAASHDLRQPLQTLKLLQGLLEETVRDEKSRTLVKRMGDTLGSMSSILNTVLNIKQIEAGMVHPKREKFFLKDILDRLLEEFSYQAEAKGIDLRVAKCNYAVYTDPRLLEQIIRNLISNALKYTLKGAILVGCRRRNRRLRLEVWDTGIGIPENHIGKVFNEYHQIDAPAGNRDHGLGLGLSIVKQLSDLLGLDVAVRSQPGRGSVFTIDIEPAVLDEVTMNLPAQAIRSDSGKRIRKGSLLVIEDEDSMRDLLRMGLEQAGHTVLAVENAAQAIESIQDNEFVPDAILADYNLAPSSNGLAVIESLRQTLGRHIPALILTGDISSKALLKYARYKVPHLSKPAKLKEVIAAIGDLLSPPIPDNSHANPTQIRGDDLIEIIDDEPAIRETVQQVFKGAGWAVATYGSAEEYLAQRNPDRMSCLLVDAYLPGMSGLELLQVLREAQHRFPIIVITGRSDVQMAVEAMQNGAANFLEKPFSAEEIHRRVQQAFERLRNSNERFERRDAARAVLAVLTRRQREILERISVGQPNKIIAAEMNLSQRTVENHRASIMRRTGATSLPALLRIVVAAEE